jgi:hypothetical protein
MLARDQPEISAKNPNAAEGTLDFLTNLAPDQQRATATADAKIASAFTP